MFYRKKATATKLREAIARLHVERGPDISSLTVDNVEDPESDVESDNGEPKDLDDAPLHLKTSAPMPFDDLVKMRDEISFNIQRVTYKCAMHISAYTNPSSLAKQVFNWRNYRKSPISFSLPPLL